MPTKTNNYRFEIFKSHYDKKFYWHMRSVKGGKVVSQSEGYSRRTNATATVVSIAQGFKTKPEVWLLEADGVTVLKY